MHLIAANSPVIDNDDAALPADAAVSSGQPARHAGGRRTHLAQLRGCALLVLGHIDGLVNHPWSVPSATFDTDARAGKLPSVAWLFAPGALSEHPGDFNHTGKPLLGPGM